MSTATGAAFSRVGLFVATWGYVGYAPFAPGTFGSAAGLAVYVLLRQWPSAGLELAVMLALFVIGIWSAHVAERVIGSTDPQPIVVDEVVGMLITLAFLPVTVCGALLGFFVFRLFDVIKPWPSRRFESLHGGLGVMADDAMAAVYANLVLRALALVLPAGWIV